MTQRKFVGFCAGGFIERAGVGDMLVSLFAVTILWETRDRLSVWRD